MEPASSFLNPNGESTGMADKEASEATNALLDRASLNKNLKQMMPEVLDANRKPTGKLYSFEDYTEINDVILRSLLTYLLPRISGANGKLDIVNEIIAGLNNAYRIQIKRRIMLFKALVEGTVTGVPEHGIAADGSIVKDPEIKQFHEFVRDMSMEQKKTAYEKYQQAFNSWPVLAKFATASLKEYGIVVKPGVLNRIEQLLRYKDKTLEPEGTENLIAVPDRLEEFNVTVTESRAVKDYSQTAINIALYSTASTNLKMFLAMQKSMEFSRESAHITTEHLQGNNQTTAREIDRDARQSGGGIGKGYNNFRIRPRINSLGLPVLVNPKELFIKLLEFSRELHRYDMYGIVDLLKQNADPDLVSLGIQLEATPEHITNELFKLMDNQYVEHTRLVLFNKNSQGTPERSVRNTLANKDNEIATITRGWKENQKVSKSVNIVNGRMIVNKKGAIRIYDEIVRLGNELTALKVKIRNEARLAKNKPAAMVGRAVDPAIIAAFYAPYIAAKKALEDKENESMEFIARFLDYLGITGITQEMFSWISKTRSWEGIMKISGEGNAYGVFSVLAQSLKNASGIGDHESAELLENANPLYRETTMINYLAELAAKFNKKLTYATNHKSINGETIHNFSLPSFASNTYKALYKQGNPLYRRMMENNFTQKAHWLLDQIPYQGGPRLTYLEGVVSNDRPERGVERREMSVREHYLVPLLMFNQSSMKADLVDMTKSDKNLTSVISNVTKFRASPEGYGLDVIEQFVNIYKAEQERIIIVQTTEVSDPNLAKGGDLFFFIPAFNKINMDRDVAQGIITQAQYDAVWNSEGKMQAYNKEEVEPLIVQYVDKAILSEMVFWMKKLESFDGFQFLPEKQVNFVLAIWDNLQPYFKEENGKKVLAFRDRVNRQMTSVSKEKAYEKAAALMIKEYVTQAFIVNTFSAMIVSGDPAIAFTDSKLSNANVNDAIKETLKNYQKHQAKDIASGANPAFSSNTFVSLVIKDEKMYSEMAKVNSVYQDQDTIADGQELTTVREHLTVMFAEGKIADTIYSEMIGIINTGLRSLNKYYEFTKPAHTQVILQAQKPVYVNRRFTEGSYVIDYIKTSSFALLPQFTIGTEIDKLRQKMEGTADGGEYLSGALEGTYIARNHINRAVFASGKKLGQPLNPVSLFDPDGKIKDGVLESKEFANAQQTLTREGFKIQREVPFNEHQEHISLVSQADRFITAGIGHIENFQLPGRKPMSGRELKQLRLDTIKEMSDIALEKFTTEIGGVEKISDMDGAWVSSRLVNPVKFFDKLLAEAVSRGYSENDIELLQTRGNNGGLEIPLWFSGSASKLESLLMSLIGEITIPKMPGKSFVQGSSIGIKRYTTVIPPNAGIKYIKNFDPTKGLGFVTKNEGAPSGAAQVLVPFSFFDQGGKNLKIEDFITGGEIDPAKLPDDLLRMVGLRIPNQGMNSMIPIQIVGFLPTTMGDLIIVPAEITTQMGSNFNLNMLYTYRRNYLHDAQTGSLSLYPGDSRVRKLQDTYFDIYWSVLTHPKLFTAVTCPLEQPDLQEENELAQKFAPNELSNFFMPSSQIESYIAHQAARRMVSLASLSATFSADIEDMNLRLEIVAEDSIEAVFILFKDLNGELLKLNRLSGSGRSIYRTTKGEMEYRTKLNVNSVLLSELLDYSKNRTIDTLNINLKTYPVVEMLINLESQDGRSIGWSHIARFMQQPIIKEYVDLMPIENDTFVDHYAPAAHSLVVTQLMAKYLKSMNLSQDSNIEQQALSPDDLLQMIGQKISSSNLMNQLSILKTFDILYKAAGEKMRAQAIFNRGPHGPGANIIEAAGLQDKALALVHTDSMLAGLDELLSQDSQRGDEFFKTVGTAIKLGMALMPYESLRSSIAQLATLKGKGHVSTKDVLKVNNALKAYIMSSNQIGISNNTNGRLAELLYGSNGQECLANRVLSAQNTNWGRLNFFIRNLRTRVATNVSTPSTIYYLPSEGTVFDDRENTKAIIEMLTGNECQKNLIHDLIDYNYLTGSTGGITSFNAYIPVCCIIGKGLHVNMNKILESESLNGLTSNFIQQFLQHNPDFAPRLSRSLNGTVNQLINAGSRDLINESLVLISPGQPDAPFGGQYPKYFSLRRDNAWLLYKFAQIMKDSSVSYVRIDTLGTGSIKEYNASDLYKRSLIPNNRAMTQACPDV